ncbi:ABC transporter permease [Xanthobacter agilis]|uniref:ABC-2 type transport system permease protein n=1 Tax=Xanthobacter agilis TaxID=47492 RepID=A0ABU0LHI1_XANAG|nr:ABC transporter permease [Xanthobacter agilis]MDQ0506585.1 ABC-2 type transport system permease protein [Xanthobacter agilis]
MGAIMGAMALTLLRDRGALAMTFVLPPLLFLLFAAIFSGAGGDAGALKVAAARLTPAPAAEAFLDALAAAPDTTLRLVTGADAAARVEAQVRDGRADVGLLVRDDPGIVTPASPLVIVADPGRAVAAALLMARIQTLFTTVLPGMALSRVAGQVQVLVGPFSPEQARRLKEAVARAPELVAGGGAELMARQSVEPAQGQPAVTYYAGAIALLFLLFSAVQGAASLVEERRSGVFDRILMTRGGIGALVAGKFAFLLLQGLALLAVLFAVAQLVYGVDAAGHLWSWLVVSVAAAAAAAGVALPLAAASRTRQQAQTLSTFVVLLLSAVGGSMAPRFLMPEWLQRLGDLTPTAWGIEAYQDALWRGAPLDTLLPALAVLLAYGAAGALLSFWLLRRAARLG